MAETNLDMILFDKLLGVLYSEKAISVPTTFHSQCREIKRMLKNDVTGVINTILKYSIDSAQEANYRVECSLDNTLEKALNEWLSEINEDYLGHIPTGMKTLAKEYFKERWQGSSLCILRASGWKEKEFAGNKILIPTSLYFVNGESVYINVKDDENIGLDSYSYYLGQPKNDNSNKLPKVEEDVIIQKPFNRIFDKYAIPYLISNGVFKNYKAIEILQDKGDEVITKIIPYMMLLKKGTERLSIEGKVNYDDKDMVKINEMFDKFVKKYKINRGQVPSFATPFDTQLEHLIPDLTKVLRQELFNQGYRALLAGLGFVDVIQGIASTRKESVLNPKPFVAEVNDGISDFKEIITDLIKIIINKNKENHNKLFSKENKIKIVSSQIKINTEIIMDVLRGGYDRGTISITTYQEILGVDSQVEKERREQESKDGLDELFYPHIIQNQEEKGIDTPGIKPALPKPDKKVTPDKQPGTPEVTNFKNAELEEETYMFGEFAPVITDKYIRLRQRDPKDFDPKSFKTITLSADKGIKAIVGKLKGETSLTIQSYLFEKIKWSLKQAQDWVKLHTASIMELDLANLQDELEIAPYQSIGDLPKSVKKYPEQAQKVWLEVFNSIYNETHDEVKSFSGAWSQLKKWLKRHGNKGENKNG